MERHKLSSPTYVSENMSLFQYISRHSWERWEMPTQFWWGSLGGLSVDGKITLNWFSEEKDGKVWA